MLGKFLWGATWRTLAFTAVAAAPIWYANQGPGWSADELIAKGDTVIVGKPGLIVVALMQPGRYDPKFFENFLDKLFSQVIPWPINVLAGADTGTVLVDPTQPFMTKRFEPRKLADMWGREADVDGIPWIEKYRRGELRWEKPSTTVPYDLGVFVYPERKQGLRFAAAKTSIKARYLYYAELPGGILPHYAQTRAMVEGAIAETRRQNPQIVAGEVADAFDPHAKEEAIFRVLDAGSDTLVLGSAQPIYSSFEELEGSFVGVRKTVETWRKANGNKPIKIVIAPYMASQLSFDALFLDHLAATTPRASKPGQKAMAIASLHGLPTSLVNSDSWTSRVKAIERRIAPKMATVMRAKGYQQFSVVFASEGFADTLEDPDDVIVSVRESWNRAVREGYAVANAVPLDFLAENTDSLFSHSVVMFGELPGYRPYQGPPANIDWSKPFMRDYRIGATQIRYGGTLGGATVPRQSLVLAEALSSVFKQK